MAVLKIYNGSSFVTAVGKVFDGSVWKAKMEFYDGTNFIKLYSGVVVIIAATKSITNFAINTTCWADVKVDNDGDLYSGSASQVFSSYETWLDEGLNTEVWVQRTIISGSLATDAGSGRLVCSTDRRFGLTRAAEGTDNCVIDLKFYDAASGGNLLDTQRVTLSAQRINI